MKCRLRMCSQSLAHPVKYRCPGKLFSSCCGLLGELSVKLLAFFGEPAGVKRDRAQYFKKRVDLYLGSVKLVYDADLLILENAETRLEISFLVAEGVV